MQIFAEILPRLGCVNVAVMGGVEQDVKIKCDQGIVIGDEEFSVPGLELATNSISGVTSSSEGVTFRLKLKQNEKMPTLISPASFNYGGRMKFPSPEIVTDQTYTLICQCGARFGSITPARVLPLPSASWQADSLDWYCCVNKLNKPPVMKPRTSDLLYNSYSFVVDMTNITEDAVNISSESKEVINENKETDVCEGGKAPRVVTCNSCEIELGSLVRDSLQIWCDSALLRCGEISMRSNKEVESAQDCFKMVINSYVIESISAMPKVMLKNRLGKSLVLWIIDKDLSVAKSGKQGVVKSSVMKVLFKDGSDVPDNTMEIIELSNKVFNAGLQMLEKSTENFPNNFKVANDFKVSYFPKC